MTIDEAADDCLLDRLTPEERAELEQTLTRVLDGMLTPESTRSR